MLERRQDKRYALRLPARVRWKAPGGSVGRAQGKTGDVSSSGLLVELPTALPVGTTINVTINLPVALTKVPVELSCVGRVVRKNRRGKIQGIAAIIEDFELRAPRLKAAKTLPSRKASAGTGATLRLSANEKSAQAKANPDSGRRPGRGFSPRTKATLLT
jgi:hypothetical protein